MENEKIKEKIRQEGFDTNVESDWYIWINCYKLGAGLKTN